MSKILTVVIPYYDETWEEIFPILSSLNIQIGVDKSMFNVLLVNDGKNNRFARSFLDMFSNLDIKQLQLEENRGPGVARQRGLDTVTSDFVMFCDADDVLHNVGSIELILKSIRDKPKTTFFISTWLEELKTEKENIYITHNPDRTWMHGKVFNVSFLRKNNIRFHEELRVHEDSYFLELAFRYGISEARHITPIVYVWKWRENSITRANGGEYTYTSVPTYIYAFSEVFKRLEETLPKELPTAVTEHIIYIYLSLHTKIWFEVDEKHLIFAENSVKEFLKPYFMYLIDSTDIFFIETYCKEYNKVKENVDTSENFTQWLNRMKKDLV